MTYFKKMGRRVLAMTMAVCLSLGLICGISFVGNTVKEVKAADTGFTKNDFLKCNGTYIKNNYGKGSNVYLRGTNAGGVFVQESWMNATNAGDYKTTMATLKNRFGESTMYNLLDLYESNYWTEADFDNCKNLGMSVIRVPFTYMNLYRQSGNSWVLKDNAFSRLDWFVEQASKRGIYVILDLHGAFGSQNGQDHSGEVIDNVSDVTFFSNDTLKNQTLELWKVVAARYAGNPAVAAYDTLNEPGEKAGTTNSKHWAFYNQMYNAIRSVDPDHIIIMESCWGTSNLPNPSTYGWTNVMYEYHHYPWDYQSDLSGQKNAVDNLVNSVNNANYGVPTYIGEFTCFDLQDGWTYELDKFNKEGWHYTSWSYKTTNSGSWGIYKEKTTDKVDIWNDSEATIRTKWGAASLGTGDKGSNGLVYNVMKVALPGTVVMADTALTDDSYFSIKTNINGKYVCAENYGTTALISDRTSAGEWEQFRVVYNSDGTVSFQSRANNKYLCAVFDDTDTENPILPRSNNIGTWEKFYVEQNNDGTYSLRTYVNNYYVQADINDTNAGILHAIGTSVGTWEKLTFEAKNSAALPKVNGGQQETTQPSTEAPTQAPTQKPTETLTEEEASVDIPTTSGKYGKNFKAVAYYPNWYGDFTSKVQWDKLTHVNYSFALPNDNGTIDSVSGSASVINSLISVAHANDVKVNVAVGGWSYSDGRECARVFENATNTDAKRQSLANAILAIVDQYGFDGVDIDWEYPTASSASQFTSFMRYLRTGLTSRGKVLTSAVQATGGTYQTDEVLQMVDWINVMAYDGDAGSGHSPYSLIVNSYNYWHGTRGMDASKVVLGVPFYERPNWASYADIVNANSANAYNDSAVINGTTVYYNGINTMSQKAKFAAENAGGIMIWEISQDTTNSNLSLMNAIYNSATAVVGKGGTTATVTDIPGTISIDSYGDKTSGITINTEGNVKYAGNLVNNSYLDYYIKAAQKGTYTINLPLAAGDAQYNAKNIIVKLNDTVVATVPITASSSWTTFVNHTADITLPAKGTYKLSIVADSGACNVADLTVSKKAEETTVPVTEKPTEAPTEKPTEAPTQAPEDDFTIEINGYQISTTVEGHRVVYSVADPNDEVVSSGLVYGLSDYATAADMVVNSSNSSVKSYQSTKAGKCPISYSTFEGGQSYTMTMQFVNTAKYFSDKMMVRAYAQLKNGKYVYSDVKTYTIYSIADTLYQGRKMNTFSGHSYLYDKILKVVNSNYKEVDYNWNDIVVKPWK